ncbi:DNA polymerase epsilon subunit 4 [Juglans microcarpa x Juglans regia]|uniref:DNA polymerase epsilon subunit 4 n=1 Tax=Juglans microcarpa x Juglans regia TaxID=2249226 RepID=UPI001B7F3B92|nr:DNA polymerase epsilon subunit 4 [Juglans microcarpa x Juglans regia]
MEEEENNETIRPEFPTGRVKKIMKLDKDINKVNSEALFLVSCSAELFIRFLAEKSAEVAKGKKRRIVKLEHIRIAVKRHRPTSDFLLDSLPLPAQPLDRPITDQSHSRPAAEKPVPAGTRRIDDFFNKSANKSPSQIDNEES